MPPADAPWTNLELHTENIVAMNWSTNALKRATSTFSSSPV